MNIRYLLVSICLLLGNNVFGQYPNIENDFDRKVKAFLEDNSSNWQDMNVPLSDGKLLYDIIV